MKAAFYTLGCKVNQYETEFMAELLRNAGFEIVKENDEADYYIVNSCTVTATADQKTRKSIRKFKRNHPNSTVILTGCMPQAFPEEAKELIEADIVFSNKNDGDILSLINEYNLNKNRLIKIEEHKAGDNFWDCSIDRFHERIRAFVKIEDGCDRFCSYCIIPKSRGRVRSKSLDMLKNEIETLSNAGIKEIVLVGMPAKFRDELGETFYVAQGFGTPCIQVMSKEVFEHFCSQIMQLPANKAMILQYTFTATAVEVSPNSQGRVQLPQTLRENAKLDSDALVIGLNNRIEIWSKSVFEDYVNSQKDQLADAVGSLSFG